MFKKLKQRIHAISTKYVWIYSVLSTCLIIGIVCFPDLCIDLFGGRATNEDIEYAQEIYYSLREVTSPYLYTNQLRVIDRYMERGFREKSRTWLKTYFQMRTALLLEVAESNGLNVFSATYPEETLYADELIKAYAKWRGEQSPIRYTYFTRTLVLLQHALDLGFSDRETSAWLLNEYRVQLKITSYLNTAINWLSALIGLHLTLFLPHPLLWRLLKYLSNRSNRKVASNI